MKSKLKEFAKNIFATTLLFIAVFSVVKLVTYAGVNLDAVAPPAPTMNTAADVYNSLAGTFDSSAIVASSTGNAIQIAKCIEVKLSGGICP